MGGSLDGIRVVDITTVLMGPWAAQMLGDMGADVIKVETPAGDIARSMGPARHEGMAAIYLNANRNKRSIVLDLTQDAGLRALHRLISEADVFVHNLRPRVVDKFGLGYESFKDEYPDLIYCAARGFRADSPMANRPAYDDIIQTAAGYTDLLTHVTGHPRYLPTLIADKVSAYGVLTAVLAAIAHRARGGGGQAIEVPMYETLVDFLMVENLYGATFDPPIAPMGYERIMNIARRPYATKDGFLTVLPYTDKNWRDFFILVGREDMLDDPRFKTFTARLGHSEEIYAFLGEVVATRTTDEWVRDLETAQIPVMKVYTKEDLLDEELLCNSGFWHSINHPTEGKLRFTDPPLRFSKTPSTIRDLPPLLGQHSAEILTEAGYSEAEIKAFFESGVTASKAGKA